MTHDELMQKHHKILRPAGYVEVGEGWFPLIDSLCTDLQKISNDTGLQIEAEQIKEKFGGLRFYTSTSTKPHADRITVAEEQALVTCEVCGAPGKQRDGGWIRTLCDEHAK